MKKDTWNFTNLLANTEGVYCRLSLDGGKLYGVEVRFNNRLYDAGKADFDDIATVIFRRSKRAVTVISDKKMFKSGLLYLMVDLWRCDNTTMESVIKFLTDKVFASIKRVTSADLDPC